MSKKIGIVGSRDYCSREPKQTEAANNLWRRAFITNYVKDLPTGTTAVSGAGGDVDRLAIAIAKHTYGLDTLEFKPQDEIAEAESQGRTITYAYACYLRDEKIAKASSEVVAFWDLNSRGTAHTLRFALNLNKPITVFDLDGEEVPRSVAIAKVNAILGKSRQQWQKDAAKVWEPNLFSELSEVGA